MTTRKFFISYAWSRQYCGTYTADSGFGNCYATCDHLTEEVIQKCHDDIKLLHVPSGSKLVAEVDNGSGVKIEITVLNLIEVEV